MKTNSWMTSLVIFGAGVIFAVGLGISGMTLPTKVIGFLDVTGKWDATLLFVLGAATGTTLILFRFVFRREKPLLAEKFYLPTRRDIDARLVVGALLFGVGWGLGGLCPGPALVSIASGLSGIFIFVAAMGVGSVVWALIDKAITPKS